MLRKLINNHEIIKSTERILYYDILKVVAAFIVVFYHLNILKLGFIEGEVFIPNINSIIMNISSIGVPIFFMVNGALMLNKKEYSFRHILKRAVKLILLYCFWSIVVVIICAIIRGNLFDYNIMQLLLNRKTDIDYLWFFRTLAILTLLTPILKRIYLSENKVFLYMVMIGLFIFPFVYNYLVLLFNLIDYESLKHIPRTGFFTLYSVEYFLIGAIISKNIEKYRKKHKNINIISILIFCLGLLLVTIEVTLWTNINNEIFDSGNSVLPTIGALCMSSAIFILLSNFKSIRNLKVKKIIQYIGENSIGVYIFHMPIITFMKFYFIKRSMNIILAIIITIIIIILSLTINEILKRIPILKNMLKI